MAGGHRGGGMANGKCQNGTNEEEEEDEENASSNGGAHFPAKFAYLFLFDSADTKKLSMGLDELMDSLVCQQLLVQLTEQELMVAANCPKENGRCLSAF
jgi:hypothetical protein